MQIKCSLKYPQIIQAELQYRQCEVVEHKSVLVDKTATVVGAGYSYSS